MSLPKSFKCRPGKTVGAIHESPLRTGSTNLGLIRSVVSFLIFYSILLAISEYVLFQYSYLISSLLIIILIALYVKSIYQSKQISIIVTGMLMMFYGFMYVILQLQDYSLLIGTVALFIILAAIMFFTRKINWFDVLSNKANINRVE